jgi:hypothetical protein
MTIELQKRLKSRFKNWHRSGVSINFTTRKYRTGRYALFARIRGSGGHTWAMNALSIIKELAPNAYMTSGSYHDKFDCTVKVHEYGDPKLKPETKSHLKALQDKLVAMGVKNIHFDWAPGAYRMTAEKRAQDVIQVLEAIERGEFTRVNIND